MTKGKGGKNQKKKKTISSVERMLILKEDSQEYGQITKSLGNCRFEIQCFDGKTYLAHIRGNMRQRDWIQIGDIVLICLRDFQNDKVDIVLRYNYDEVHQLKSMGELPESLKNTRNINLEDNSDLEDDSAFIFSTI